MRRVVAWALIVAGIVAFLVAGDVRTNWVIGDLAPELGEVALPRLGTIALMLGLALLAWHQARARRWLSETRYRGPSVLVLLALIAGLSVLIVLPVRSSINLALDGGIPDLAPVLIWTVAAPIATLLVTGIGFRGNPMPGLRLFRDARPVRHVAIGIGVGAATQIVLLAVVLTTASVLTREPVLQVPAGPLPGVLLPGQPLWLGAVSSLVLAPVSEELFFRGLALHAWLREYGRWVALIGSSVVFGLVHYGLNPLEGLLPDLPWLAIPAVSGLVLGHLAVRTESLIAPITAHATMNAITLLLLLGLGR
jgi:membrane protease YdiL (CAAX protease family)